MNKERLEFYLNRKNIFGYNTKTDSDNIAWVILSKRSPLVNFFERFSEKDFPVQYKEQMKIKKEPYKIWIAELKRSVYEGDRFPINEDYLINETYNFSTLEDADNFLESLGLTISEIKWSCDIEFM